VKVEIGIGPPRNSDGAMTALEPEVTRGYIGPTSASVIAPPSTVAGLDPVSGRWVSDARDAVLYAWRSDSGDWVTDVVVDGASGLWRTELDPTTGDPLVFVEDDTEEMIWLYRGSP
jgi:hypothetical protein